MTRFEDGWLEIETVDGAKFSIRTDQIIRFKSKKYSPGTWFWTLSHEKEFDCDMAYDEFREHMRGKKIFAGNMVWTLSHDEFR